MINRFYGPNRFLSNFWPILISFEGVTYPSVEHAYQAAKTLNFQERKSIAACKTPGQAKRAGRHITVRKDWNFVRIEIMRHLVRKKFQDPELRRLLKQTGDELLIEGNFWHDTFWGMDLSARPLKGNNYLGKILMEVREEFT
jgi:ribA/ribD-fused uncharacterized protein